ncbi:MAG TPA: HAD-IC family P-type ATPase [Thermoanaerobaculia bacterium]|nr:HAD-IC family P-type ATPase [Thermoanaerobaculia bacterium]
MKQRTEQKRATAEAATRPVLTAGLASTAWHALSAGRAVADLASGDGGLTAAEARRRLGVYGENRLVAVRPTPWWRILAAQFRGLVVWLLAAAAAVALAMGEGVEAAAVGVVLLLNAALGFAMEWRARQAMGALSRLQVQAATVVRDGRVRSVDARELVPGDLVVLDAGSAVPADARLLEAHELTAVEAPLTGESVPVGKGVEPVAEGAPLAERRSMLFKGTLVAAGEGRAVVTATGRDTEVGRIAALVAETESGPTPLERRLDRLGRRLVVLTLSIAAAVTLLGVARGEPWLLMVETGLALAVAAVPEGLPVVATLVLALGMARMAKRRALVRRLPAVETLGSATVICSDKTGTLTGGEMTVVRLAIAAEEGANEAQVSASRFRELSVFNDLREPAEGASRFREALAAGVLANHATARRRADGSWETAGDPTEVALLVAGAQAGLEPEALLAAHPRLGEVPFSSERMWMASFHRAAVPADSGKGSADSEKRSEKGSADSAAVVVAYVKGAPERLFALAAFADAGERERWAALNRRWAADGLRVLALGRRRLPAGVEVGEGAVGELELLGLVALADPPAPGVAAAVAAFRGAGVRTVMITGDQAVTAAAVARQVGVLAAGDETLDGRELAALDDDALADRASRVTVYSRASPGDKLRIVEALRSRGEVVAMLGDGVNDAPALKRADIGVAMGGRGTDVAKETADLVLQDDRFETVVAAVEEGRVIYDNVRKFVYYLFSCNLAEVLVLFLAGLVGAPLPLTALQILWLNLLTDVLPALALAAEPAEPDVLRRPPRDPASGILSRPFLARVAASAGLITAVTLGVFAWGLAGGDEVRARTLAFLTLALAQLAFVLDSRSPRPLILSWRQLANRWVLVAVVGTALLQVAAVTWAPLADLFEVTAPRAADWALVAVAAALPVLVGQGWKLLRSGGSGERSTGEG